MNNRHSESILGVVHVQVDEVSDWRGALYELFRSSNIKDKYNVDFPTSQITISKSKANVLRGIHLSSPDVSQIKIVHCITGSMTDYLVDLRRESPTFLEKIKIDLDSLNPSILIVPHGVGHAYITHESGAMIFYAFSSEFNLEKQITVSPFDNEIGFNYPERDWLISEKDSGALSLNELYRKGIFW